MFRILLLVAGSSLAIGVPAAAQQVPVVADTIVDTGPSFSPRGAALRSLVLPGWGQAWVGSPGRGSAFFAMEAGSLWMLYRTQLRLNDAREIERFLHESGRLSATERYGLVVAREDQREDWITMSIFILFLSAADAYVAAQLADFDERIAVAPAAGGGVQLRASIPVGRR